MKHKLLKIILPFALICACIGFTACKKTKASPAQLSSPEQLQITDDMLSWEGVENADGYAVYIENAERLTTECRYDLGGLDQTKIYKIEVMAYSDAGSAHSKETEIIYVGQNAPATEGLEFRQDINGGWFLSKYAADENGVCVLPETYGGKQLTSISQKISAEGAEKVKVLYLPSGLSDYTLGNGRSFFFNNLTGLESVYIRAGNERFVSAGNSIIDKTENALILGGTKSVIPDYVTKIGASAFYGRGLKTFTVSDRIAEIGSAAFSKCEQLETVTLPANMAVEKLGSVFSGCASLREIKIPNGITELNTTFSNCTSLTEAEIPDGVISIKNAFSSCTSLTKVTLPESIQNMYCAFRNCAALRSIEIPKGVQNLDLAFLGCASLENVTVPGSVKLLAGTFSGCTSLKNIVLEEGVTEFDLFSYANLGGEKNYAFRQCTSLTNISLPSTLIRIAISSFKDCTSLKSVVMPKGIRIEGSVFENCPLEEVYYRGTEEEWEENVSKIDKNNAELFSATRYYYSETAPTEEGNYWRFVEGVPAKWN